LQIALAYGLYVCVFPYKLLLECTVHVYVFCKVAVGYGAAAIKYLFYLFFSLLCLSFSLLGLQRGVYDNLFHAIVKICKEEGPCALYRGLCPSLIGVMPYAAMNYFAYDSMRKMYKTATKKQEIGHLQTMLMGSIAGVLSSTVTFPLEVARRRMQVPNLPMSPTISVQQAFFRPNPTIDF
jgi:hypothetical protein